MKEKPELTSQTKKEDLSATRRKAYVSYIERFPLYSTLLVLKDYEDSAMYEECAIIRDALLEYEEKYVSKFPEKIKFPMHLTAYQGKEHQDMLISMKIIVEEKVAREKATLIKLNLPVKK